MNDEDRWISAEDWEKIRRVIQAAVAYCQGTNPDDYYLDTELRQAVGGADEK